MKPAGILSRHIWEKKRLSELHHVIQQHKIADFPVDPEWTEEYRELLEKYWIDGGDEL